MAPSHYPSVSGFAAATSPFALRTVMILVPILPVARRGMGRGTAAKRWWRGLALSSGGTT
jgi:hypothetical protein